MSKKFIYIYQHFHFQIKWLFLGTPCTTTHHLFPQLLFCYVVCFNTLCTPFLYSGERNFTETGIANFCLQPEPCSAEGIKRSKKSRWIDLKCVRWHGDRRETTPAMPAMWREMPSLTLSLSQSCVSLPTEDHSILILPTSDFIFDICLWSVFAQGYSRWLCKLCKRNSRLILLFAFTLLVFITVSLR